MNINCYNKHHIKEIKKQYRGDNGRFAKRWPKIIFYLSIIVGILLVVYLSQIKSVEYKEVEVIKVLDTTSEIIKAEKEDILNRLEKCESSGNADAINWVDGGVGKNTASFGAYMFKIGTIQHFVKGLTDFQSIALASNKAESRKLAEYIIFETEGGIYNWKNCAIKEGLIKKVEFIKELQLKVK